MPKRGPKLKPIPDFKSEAEEREFWETHDSTEYADWSNARFMTFTNLKPSTETISLRLPVPLLADLKSLANKRDVPYQSLLKMFLAERVASELRESTATIKYATRSARGITSRRSLPRSRRDPVPD
ncbi:MAG: BrnA antitoxin family protein [Chloroflexi bacterium]|nr:BrnA antitoxin family protein [Chloroflexota bacterium]